MQRLLDILLSGLALILLTPLLLPLALILRCSGEGEIFYSQERIGRGGERFGLLKFATMLKNSPNIGTGTVTIKGDPRVLPVGKFLRKTKINELPQLLNILKGEMSVIGPRPMTPDNFYSYPVEFRATVSSIRPGLSGIGSVIFRDEESMLQRGDDARRIHSEVIAPYKAALENWYVHRRNIWIDLALIGLTVWTVLRPRSRAVWALFPSLPAPSEELKMLLDVSR